MTRKLYTRPDIVRIPLDKTIVLRMQSQPGNPPPRGGGKGGPEEPFKSPFGDKPFG